MTKFTAGNRIFFLQSANAWVNIKANDGGGEMKKTTKDLYEGQIVAIPNCSGTFLVIKKIAKNLYLINFKGKPVEVSRQQIAVLHKGIYRTGAFNEESL